MSEKSSDKIPVALFDKTDPKLNTSYEVNKAIELAVYDGEIIDESKKKERLEPYLGENGQLNKIFNNPNNEDRQRRLEIYKKELLYPSVLIDKNNVPESYFALQQKIARERNQTDLLDTSQEARKKESEIIYNDQKKSLDNWVDYLSLTDTKFPTWFKYYALSSVTKLGVYDKSKNEFSKRTKSTTTIFPDLNREALSYTYDVVKKHYLKHEKHSNNELQKIVEGANFSKIYAFAIDKATPASKENKEKTQGEWTKFNKGDDATALYESLQGHGTGWCTAGESMAQSQLNNGDFYVYYSKDEKGLNTIPRIAIRMENNKVAEVRGIEKDQNLEGSMTDIAKEKYHQLPGGEKFDKKDHDMKLLTLIDNKVRDKQELTKDELNFLYEIDSKIESFGYHNDPRIKEIKDKRDFKSDLTIVYDCSLEQIVNSPEQIAEDTKVYIGDLDNRNVNLMNNRKNPLVIYGNANFGDCNALTSLPDNITFNGDVDFIGCTSLTSLPEKTTFNGDAFFGGCSSLTSIPENTTFYGYAQFSDCTSLTSIAENITFNGNAGFDGCTALTYIPKNTTFYGFADFTNCTSLTSIEENTIFNNDVYFEDCSSLVSIPENTTFCRNANFKHCTSLTSIPENTTFIENADFSGCTALVSIPENTTFSRYRQTDFSGCTSLASIPKNITFGRADFPNCTSLTSIPENTTFNAYADFMGCTSLTSIEENTTFAGKTDFSGCTSLTSIHENTTFNGYAAFSGCTSLTSIHENTTFNGRSVDFYGCNLSLKLIKQLRRMKEEKKIKGELHLFY